ncbi:MAG TPA: NAD(P)/FAD-dependent oxidoreductase [Thermomicrobiales bacterium]|nr:NAD(P)/FAD-dependent oxidoreductase [Thermomicrobiales bacterium]
MGSPATEAGPGQVTMQSSYDVIVVGARVAGSITATLLGQAGYRVLLADAGTFPSDTLSTHLFRGAGLISVLDRLDVLEAVEMAGTPRLLRNYNYSDGVPQANPRPPHPGRLGFCMSVRRFTLDNLLVERAAACPTVDVVQATSVRSVFSDAGGRVTGVEVRGPDGQTRQVAARLIVGADGRHSTVAKFVRPEVQREADAVRAIYYCDVTGYDRVAPGADYGAEFSLCHGEMAYGLPSDGGVTCVAVSVGLDRFHWLRTDPERHFREAIHEHTAIAPRFEAATPVTPVRGYGPQRNYVRVPAGPGWALVGDAGIYQDPWSGQGMDLAGMHATFLAESVIAWLSGETDEADAMATYHRRRDEHALPVFESTVRLAPDLGQVAALWGFPVPAPSIAVPA